MNPDYKQILDSIADGIYFVDRDRRITYWNKGAEQITGFAAEKVAGHFCHDNILNHVGEDGVRLCFTACPLAETIQDGKPRHAEVYLHHADGHRVPILVRVMPMRNEQNEIIGAVETFTNNSTSIMARRHIRRLEDKVNLDALTNIANRRYAEIKLKSALDEFRQYRLLFGIAFIDIDHFKYINDTHGHEAGDKALTVIAKTLADNIRVEDVAARWGGDEFLVLFYNIDKDSLHAAADKLRLLVEQSHPRLEGKDAVLTVSIGATLAREDDDLASLMKRVDQLMYQGKQASRNRVTFE
jgi:diguanylate cyclase (GGDEF)-like protein/PAS domain S-box-containing protein